MCALYTSIHTDRRARQTDSRDVTKTGGALGQTDRQTDRHVKLLTHPTSHSRVGQPPNIYVQTSKRKKKRRAIVHQKVHPSIHPSARRNSQTPTHSPTARTKQTEIHTYIHIYIHTRKASSNWWLALSGCVCVRVVCAARQSLLHSQLVQNSGPLPHTHARSHALYNQTNGQPGSLRRTEQSASLVYKARPPTHGCACVGNVAISPILLRTFSLPLFLCAMGPSPPQQPAGVQFTDKCSSKDRITRHASLTDTETNRQTAKHRTSIKMNEKAGTIHIDITPHHFTLPSQQPPPQPGARSCRKALYPTTHTPPPLSLSLPHCVHTQTWSPDRTWQKSSYLSLPLSLNERSHSPIQSAVCQQWRPPDAAAPVVHEWRHEGADAPLREQRVGGAVARGTRETDRDGPLDGPLRQCA